MTAVSSRSTDWRHALLLVSVAALVRLAFAALLPLFPDETYYWDWSRHLAAGYFDHPPAIAVLIRAGTTLLAPFGAGDGALGVRLGTLIAGWIAAVGTIAVARQLGGDAVALRAAVIMTVLPLAAAGLVLATPDAAVLAATAAGLYCVVRALREPAGSASSLRWWIACGVTLGLAFCSKYTSIFLPAAVVIAILIRPSLRPRLREAGPYAACVVATLVFAPVLLWNADHGWISFVFQVRHGLGAPKEGALLAAWHHEGDFFGGQAGLASPILFVLMVIATARALRRTASDTHFVLGVVALLSFGFFVYSALRQRVEPNWPAPAYVPAIALLAATSWSPRGEKWYRGGIALAAVLSACIYVQGLVPVLPIAPRKDPVGRAFGWREAAVALDQSARALSTETHATTWQAGDRYQEASEIAFQLPEHPVTFATNLSGRANQYDLWPRFADRARAGDNLALLLDDSPDQPVVVRRLAPSFGEARRGPLVRLLRGSGEIGARRVWLMVGWRGGWPADSAQLK